MSSTAISSAYQHLESSLGNIFFSYLDVKSLLNASLVCKKWKETTENVGMMEAIWRGFCVRLNQQASWFAILSKDQQQHENMELKKNFSILSQRKNCRIAFLVSRATSVFLSRSYQYGKEERTLIEEINQHYNQIHQLSLEKKENEQWVVYEETTVIDKETQFSRSHTWKAYNFLSLSQEFKQFITETNEQTIIQKLFKKMVDEKRAKQCEEECGICQEHLYSKQAAYKELKDKHASDLETLSQTIRVLYSLNAS